MNSPVITSLSKDDCLYFLHIQKTAGTSFAALLQTQFTPEETCPAYFYQDLMKMPPEQRQAYRYYRGHFGYGLLDFVHKPLRIITMLRDPVERTISNIEQARRHPHHHAHRKLKRMTMTEYLEARSQTIELANLQTRSLAMPRGPIEIYRFWNPLPSDLERAKERLQAMDFIGLVERFSESLHLLAYTFGWQPFQAEARLNTSPSRLQRDDFSETDLALLHEMNNYDLELYAFAKALFAERYNAMMRDLLDEHYARELEKQRVEKVSSLRLDMSKPIPGAGWDVHEGDFNARWTNMRDATLDLPLASDQALQMDFHIISAINQTVLDSFRLFVGEREVPLTAAPHPEGGVAISAVLTPEMIEESLPFTRIRFHTGSLARPCDEIPGSSDQRTLGVFIGDIKITPVSTP